MLNQPNEEQNNPPLSNHEYVDLAKKSKKKIIWISLVLILNVLIIIAIATFFYFYFKQETKLNTVTVIENEFNTSANDVGVKTCAPLFSQLGEKVIQGSKFTFLPFWHSQDPEKHTAYAYTSHIYPEENMRGIGMVFVAPINDKCEGAMMRTVVSYVSCSLVANNAIAQGIERQPDFNGITNFATKSGTRLMLIPVNDNSCVIISTFNADGNEAEK